jgi:hypothetical protein
VFDLRHAQAETEPEEGLNLGSASWLTPRAVARLSCDERPQRTCVAGGLGAFALVQDPDTVTLTPHIDLVDRVLSIVRTRFARQLTLVRGGNYQFSFAVKSCQACGESDGGTWEFNSAVAAMPLTPARSRKIFGLQRGADVISVISSEGWMVCVCSRQLAPYSVLGPHMPATNASSRGDALATERPQYCAQREYSVAQA